MRLLIVCLLIALAGCEEKAPTQSGPKAVTVQTTAATGTTP
jgi:hypothetical protein